MKRAWLLWLPFAGIVALFAAFYGALKNPADHVIASNMVGKSLPEFSTFAALPGRNGASTADFSDGKPRLLNVFASWCVPCVQEVGVLQVLKSKGAEITGIAVHDTPDALMQFLARNGDPYSSIGMDPEGRTQLAFGSTGVPETFVIDGRGRILHQHIGPLEGEDVANIMALLESGK